MIKPDINYDRKDREVDPQGECQVVCVSVNLPPLSRLYPPGARGGLDKDPGLTENQDYLCLKENDIK